MCVPRARLAVGVGLLLPLLAVVLENLILPAAMPDFYRNASAPLTQDQLEAFEKTGFVTLPGVIPRAMVERLLDELHLIQDEAEAQMEAESIESGQWDPASSGAHQTQCTYAFARDADGTLSRPARLHKAQGVGLRSPLVRETLSFAPLANAAAYLVRRGVPASRHPPEVDAFGTKFFPVEAGTAGSVSWHDDNYYFGTSRSHTISCVVYLRDVKMPTGCMRVLPGSHQDTVVGYARAHLYKSVPEQHGEYIPETVITDGALATDMAGKRRPAIDVEVTAGTAVLFDANLLHAAHPNRGGQSASERIAFHYIPGDLDTGFRGTSFARGAFADRHMAVGARENLPLDRPSV